MRILVSGRVVSAAGQGGAAWAVLSWALGAREIGHDVVFAESLPRSTGPAQSRRRAQYARDVERASGVRPLLLEPGDDVPAADVLINVSGTMPVTSAKHIPVRVYVDVDPAFTQAWELAGEDVGLAGHTAYATVGFGVGTDDGDIPDLGLLWLRVPPPVSLQAWPVAPPTRRSCATTIGQWRGYGTVSLGDVTLGQRVHSVRRLLPLPGRAPLHLLPAFAIHPDESPDVLRLTAAGWRWLDPAAVAGTPSTYRRYVQSSRMELGFAKAGYVDSRSGWFSDRTAAFLASGRPAVVADTGFAHALPVGEGLLTYTGVDEAVLALESVIRDEERHRRAARAFAETHLDARRIVGKVLEWAC